MNKIKKGILPMAIVATLFTFASCESSLFGIKGKGEVVLNELSLDEVNGIALNFSGNIHITQSAEQKIEVKAQQNIFDNMEIDVRNGIVEFDFDRSVGNHEEVNIYMDINTLTKIELNGSGDVNTTFFDVVDPLHVDLTGSGDMDIEVNAPEIYSSISGSGDVKISTITEYLQVSIAGSGDYDIEGSAAEADYSISGSGNISAFSLETRITDVSISGTGDIRVNVSEKLNVSISGSGDVYYKGTPTISTSISGSGDIKNANK